MESYNLIGSKECMEILNSYPDYRVFERAGFAWKGAKERKTTRSQKKNIFGKKGANEF